MKFCCVVAMRVVVASVLLYIWNIFGNLVVIFFFFIWNARGTFFLRFNSGRKSFVRGKIFSRVKSGMKRRLCVILVLCSKIVSSK